VTSLNFAGKCQDETCCKALAPASECRCHLSERLHQSDRIKARLPACNVFTADEVIAAVWRERLRIMAILADEARFEEFQSPVDQYMERVGQRACEIKEDDAIRTAPLTTIEIAIARKLDQQTMPPDGMME
jgi:hypothetical protein